MKERHEQKLIILSLVLFIALNLPIVLLFDSADFFIGLPVSYFYYFFIWIFSVLISFIVIKRYDE